MKIINYLWWQ